MNRPEVAVLPSLDAMASAAAQRAAGLLRDAVAARGVAHAMFATGNSQLAFVDALLTDATVPWADIVVFHMDEYVGVGPEHPAGFRHWIHDRIEVPAQPRATHYIDGLADPASECARYAQLLRQFPLDLCCLGIGENGHLAFNDPPVADFADPLDLKVVRLDEGHFPREADVPDEAVTVTIPALLRATRVLAVVPEARKAEPVRRALEGPVGTACPASILQRTGHATVFLEPESAALLTG
jgi:glucosamine-6-phosphate deaminase